MTAPPTEEEMRDATIPGPLEPVNYANPRILRLPRVEGGEFTGFDTIDFKLPGRRKPNMVMPNGAVAQVARTVFANKKCIMWALEVYAFS